MGPSIEIQIWVLILISWAFVVAGMICGSYLTKANIRIDQQTNLSQMSSLDSAKKYLYPSGNKGMVIGHFIVCYCSINIPNCMEIIRRIQLDFPDVDPNKVEFGKIHQSDYVKGGTIAEFHTNMPDQRPKGWDIFDHRRMEYFW